MDALSMVITNSILSKSASALAKELNVEIWEHIDAIYLLEHSKADKIDYTQLTQVERENLQVKEIEAYLHEKYQAFHLNYPVDKNKDKEIADYADRMKRQVDNLESSFQRELDWLFSRLGHQTFRNWRDPALTPLKNDMRKCTKDFSGKLKRAMDEANQDAEHYLSTKISVNSIIKLSDMIAHIFYVGDGIRVTFDESTTRESRDIAQFTWPEKYFRMAHKWKTLKDNTPSDPEREDMLHEKIQKEKLQRKLNSATEDLKKAQADIQSAQEYIETAPVTLAKKQAVLKGMEDNFTKESEELHKNYCHIESTLIAKLNTAKEKLELLQSDKYAETDKLNKVFILSFRKKEALKKHINELDRDIEETRQVYRDTEAELLLAKNTYESNIQELKDKRDDLRKQINAIEQKVSERKVTIKNKEHEIAQLQSKIDALKEQLEDFHRKYLLKTYQDIIK